MPLALSGRIPLSPAREEPRRRFRRSVSALSSALWGDGDSSYSCVGPQTVEPMVTQIATGHFQRGGTGRKTAIFIDVKINFPEIAAKAPGNVTGISFITHAFFATKMKITVGRPRNGTGVHGGHKEEPRSQLLRSMPLLRVRPRKEVHGRKLRQPLFSQANGEK